MRTVFVSENDEELGAIRARLASELPARRAGLPAAVNAAIDSPLDARAVIGTPEAVIERLRRDQARLGIDLLIVRPQLAGIERAVLERSLEWLAQTVWPAVSRLRE
jgi:alkanesulfonate monooxygenase SsuD/methylene tetrahydromethanopterin reductase-like flavin-dependent oxidoreductase (luciferase family)